jgi:hypothetical protein
MLPDPVGLLSATEIFLEQALIRPRPDRTAMEGSGRVG